MSVIMDGKDLGEFVDRCFPSLTGRAYVGRGLESEGRRLEAWLKHYDVGLKIRVKDYKFPGMMGSFLLKVVEIQRGWEENFFCFKLAFVYA